MPPVVANTVLLDTSSLLRSGLGFNGDYPTAGSARSRPWGPTDPSALIDGIVLAESLLLDGPSIARNADRLRWIWKLSGVAEVVELSEADESQIYERGAELIPHIVDHPNNVDLLRGHTKPFMTQEMAGISFRYLSVRWRDIRDSLGPKGSALFDQLDQAFSEHKPFSGAAAVCLIRLLYYLALQERIGSGLMLDPTKGFSQRGRRGRFDTTTMTETTVDAGRAIIDVFDKEVKDAFDSRRERWLGEGDRSFRFPLLTDYAVRTSEDRGCTLIEAALEIRESDEAINFRAAVADIVLASSQGKCERLDGVFARLDESARAWSARIGAKEAAKEVEVTVGVPFLGLRRALSLPRVRRRNPADGVLIFVSRLLRGP